MNTDNLYSVTSILNILFLIAAMVGGYIALRSGKHRAAGEIQSQVIEALQAELEALQSRLETLERENERLTQTVGLIKAALRRRGLIISIDGDLVTISDNGSSQSARIQEQK